MVGHASSRRRRLSKTLGVKMVGIKYFYDVPVYRLPKEKYYSQMEQHIEDKLVPKTSSLVDKMRKSDNENPNGNDWFRSHLATSFGGAWQYNEIIGYIRLHFLGTQIRGEYHAVNKKRIVKTRKKQIEYITSKLAPEIDLPRYSTSKEIYKLIIQYLYGCKKELKNRYIDMEIFKVIGQHVDWLSFYKNAQQSN